MYKMRNKIPDKQEALSIIESSKKDMDYTLTLQISEDSANTIIRNVYECFRMLGEALLISRGISTSDHIAMINELMKIDLDSSYPLPLLDNLRRLRHSINYYAYRASKEEAEYAINLAKNNFKILFIKVKEMITNQKL